MARFKYNGEGVKFPGVTFGPTLSIIFHTRSGQKIKFDAPNQTTGFVVGQDILVNAQDARVLRHLRADPRFTEIIPTPSTPPTTITV
jgi:hypothetical protein